LPLSKLPNVSFICKAVAPLIVAHCHLELSHMKGLIPEHTGLVDFVFKIVTQRHFAEDEILQAIKNAEDDMLANGIVAVGDICNNHLTITQKQQQRLAYYNFIEVSGWNPQVADIRFERSKAILNEYLMLNKGCSLSPHAPYSVSDDLWKLLQENFTEHTVTIHNQETSFEDDLFKTGTGDFTRMYALMNIENAAFKPTGKTSLQSYFQKMQTAKNKLLVHNTFTNEDDILYAKQLSSQSFFCLCINANQYIENALPPIDLLRKHQANIVIGTDSLASNWSLSIADEIKTITKNFPTIPLTEILQWATINGATALQMNDTLGSFDKGKKPGVICFAEDFATVKRLA
jgi:cytosine/adenosine deaminase-related metal-dependent hydrolase